MRAWRGSTCGTKEGEVACKSPPLRTLSAEPFILESPCGQPITLFGRREYLALMDKKKDEEEVYRFVLESIDSVPHLEALLLLWNSRPALWTQEQLAERLYVNPYLAQTLALDLLHQHFAVASEDGGPQRYGYDSSSDETNRLIAMLDTLYRRQVVGISTLIHSKPSSSVCDFARAFRFIRERD